MSRGPESPKVPLRRESAPPTGVTGERQGAEAPERERRQEQTLVAGRWGSTLMGPLQK